MGSDLKTYYPTQWKILSAHKDWDFFKTISMGKMLVEIFSNEEELKKMMTEWDPRSLEGKPKSDRVRRAIYLILAADPGRPAKPALQHLLEALPSDFNLHTALYKYKAQGMAKPEPTKKITHGRVKKIVIARRTTQPEPEESPKKGK